MASSQRHEAPSIRHLHHVTIAGEAGPTTVPLVLLFERDDAEELSREHDKVLDELVAVVQANVGALMPQLAARVRVDASTLKPDAVAKEATFTSSSFIFEVEVRALDTTYSVLSIPSGSDAGYRSARSGLYELKVWVRSVAMQQSRTAASVQADKAKGLDHYVGVGKR